MSQHLDDGDLRALRAGTLDPGRLLAADDHLVSCADCRARAARQVDLAVVASALDGARLAPDSHLSEDEVQRLADGTASQDLRARAADHLDACGVCAGEVRELRHWVAGGRASPRAWLAAAAVALLALGAVWWSREPGPRDPEALAGFSALTAEEQAQVRAALAAGRAAPPDVLRVLAGEREVLMGAAPPHGGAPAFGLIAPLATAVVSDRPRFEWHPLPGATTYQVTVANERLRTVVVSPEITATSWTPAEPLARQRVYVWQVTARRGAESIVVPTAPAPPARLLVLDARTAARLQDLEAGGSGAHVILGILYLQAGDRDDARRHLEAVPSGDPHARLAARTLEGLSNPFSERPPRPDP